MKAYVVLKPMNAILALLLVNQVLTGMLADSLPPAAFVVLHQGGGFIFAGASVLHVLLNWNWVRANYLKRRPAA